jgi:hypothetical protein
MALWWLGNAILIAVIIPLFVVLLRGVVSAVLTIQRQVTDIGDVADAMVGDLEPIPQLLTTQSLVEQTTTGLARYGAALDKIL